MCAPLRLPGSSQGVILMTERAYHEPVLLEEVLRLLQPRPGTVFLDATLGGGGHSAVLLAAGATVIALDQDREAIIYARERLKEFGDRFSAVQANFAGAARVLEERGIETLDGVLLDIGVSSHQLNEPARGFSFMQDGPLDMRMDSDGPVTAADLVNNAGETELARLFRELGEEPAARKIGRHLVERRAQRPFSTTLELAGAIEEVSPRRGRIHPATRIFQALRMAVNRELEVLEQALETLAPRLAPGGRMGVITFHSLEDRLVKQFFKRRSTEWLDRPEWPEPRRNSDFLLHLITRRPETAAPAELQRNPRSRSAKLRVAERIPYGR